MGSSARGSSAAEGSLLVAIDASTTAVKALVFDLAGNVVSEGRAQILLHNPEPDAYEQDAEEWWQGTLGALEGAVGSLSASDRARVRALTVTHQRETVVVTDEQGAPLAPALVWMDARGRTEVTRAKNTVGDQALHELSGKPACTTPSLYKLMALFERRPELRERGHVADVHAFLARRLVGRAVTSLASADPTGLVDMRRGRYAEAAYDLLGLGVERLPELTAVGARLGTVQGDVAALTGLPRETVVHAGLGDGQSACLGAGLIGPGRAYLNLGTAVVCGTLTDRYALDRAFRTLYAATPGQYCLEMDLKGGTFTLGWLETLLGEGVGRSLPELERAAVMLPPGSDGLVLLPYFCGVMNPFWNDDASGLLLGLRGEHGPAHVYRAVLEGIAFEQRLCIEGVQRALGEPLREIVVMGGGSKSELWCQILADVTGLPLVRCETAEATSLGAAMVAAVGQGLFASHAEAAAAMTRHGARFSPGARSPHYDALYREVYEGLFRDVQLRMNRLSQLRAAIRA